MRIVLTAALLFFMKIATAQTNDVGNWLIYFGNAPLKNSWNWHHEVQLRNYNAIGDLEQLLIRTGIGKDLTPGNNNLLLGYGYIHGQTYVDGAKEKVKTNEHRIFQQFITRQHFGRVYLQHRYRFEQRFIEDDFRLRFRYFLGINIPVNRSEMIKGAFYASVYNELFIHGDGTLFDRNRLYGALGFQVSKNTRLEAGIMSQIYENRSRPQFQLVVFNQLAGRP